MLDDLVRRAFGENMTAVNDVGAVDQTERLPNIVIGDEHANSAALEMSHEVLNVADRDGINPREWFIKQHEGRLAGERARDFAASPLPAG